MRTLFLHHSLSKRNATLIRSSSLLTCSSISITSSTMDSPTATVSNSTEDLSSIQTNVDSQSISNVSADLDDAEKRIQELNKQLEQSRSTSNSIDRWIFELSSLGQLAEKKAREERDHYLFMYHRTHQHFLAFEHKQLDQMRRIFDRLSADEQQKVFVGNIDDQRRPRRAFTSPSTAILLPSSFNHPLDDFDRHVEPCQEEEESKELLGKVRGENAPQIEKHRSPDI